MRSKLRPVVITVFAMLLLVGVTGCQYSYPIEISGVVRDANGTLLSGVFVTLRAQSIRETTFPIETGPDGTFKASFRVGDIEFMNGKLPKWSLELSKDLYETTIVDISPKERPKSTREPTQISTEPVMKLR